MRGKCTHGMQWDFRINDDDVILASDTNDGTVCDKCISWNWNRNRKASAMLARMWEFKF